MSDKPKHKPLICPRCHEPVPEEPSVTQGYYPCVKCGMPWSTEYVSSWNEGYQEGLKDKARVFKDDPEGLCVSCGLSQRKSELVPGPYGLLTCKNCMGNILTNELVDRIRKVFDEHISCTNKMGMPYLPGHEI